MILVDFNNVVFTGIMAQLAELDGKFEESLIRHMVMVFFLSYKKKYPNYGEMVLCCDGGNPWRRDVFPHYKARRALKRAEDEVSTDPDALDMDEFFRILNLIREEMKTRMPYKVIHVYRAEGDDAIAVLARHMPGPHVVISNDKDFGQLQRYPGVIQYSPLRKTEIRHDDPLTVLKELVIRGDGGDDVPNILSDDDVFINKGKRQKSIMSKKLPAYLAEPLETHFEADKIARNVACIDFESIPEDVTNLILEQYEAQREKKVTRQDMFTYFVAKKLSRLMDSLAHF